MDRQTIRVTMAQVRWLCAPSTNIDGQRVSLLAGDRFADRFK